MANTPVLENLTAALRERSRLLSSFDVPVEGREFVLYWMHHAVRDHENPALDAALELAATLSLPVLVYQGMSGAHAHNNDRQVAFILQGARETHAALEQAGIQCVFHYGLDDATPSPLTQLIERASVVVVEDYPVPPLTGWTKQLAANASGTPVLAVDAFCIVPMQQQSRRFERAFEYRNHNRQGMAQRVIEPWPISTPAVPAPRIDPGFVTLDLSAMKIGDLLARSDIDHSVPPVGHTTGGMTPGYERWETFIESGGLGGYARDRNDAAMDWPRGVSRLSAYLHHGFVSPFRIARDAAEHGGKGAEKFLDELLIWRELAFNFCFFTATPGRLEALPDWAVGTLADHAGDERPRLHDLEQLAASQTRDEVWNLAQDSLRIQGELHNNLRMTWAKAIPHWTPDPKSALDALLDLNNRFALDGNDPNSYGGLLWALGLFDRPFPEQAITGSLRSRSSKAHGARMDIQHYRDKVRMPASGQRRRIAVVGAGIAGLACAQVLQQQGHEVVVFEKSRGCGGRLSTRRTDSGGFDHGGQFFTVHYEPFRRAVTSWQQAGVVAAWQGQFATMDDGVAKSDVYQPVRYVGTPGMSAIGARMAEGLDVRRSSRVVTMEQRESQWQLQVETPECTDIQKDFHAVVVAAPAPQAAALLADVDDDLTAKAKLVNYDPCWTVMLSLNEPITTEFNGIRSRHGALEWMADNTSKPGRSGQHWVLHASATWSREHVEADKGWVMDYLIDEFCRIMAISPAQIQRTDAHRWLYSRVVEPLGEDCVWDAGQALGLCGDWCRGARIEEAYLSGQALAGRMLVDWAQV